MYFSDAETHTKNVHLTQLNKSFFWGGGGGEGR